MWGVGKRVTGDGLQATGKIKDRRPHEYTTARLIEARQMAIYS